jgi:transposase
MRTGISIVVSPSDRLRLEAVIRDRNAPQKHVWRCRIVLLTADGAGATAIMREAGVSKPAVWRWQERFMREGVDGLLRDKTRPSRVPRLGAEATERVVALTLKDPPDETTHWTAAMMARRTGISESSVRRIWRAHGLQPHRVRQFKLSNDPDFVDKLRDVVGLYVDPPAHAVVLSVDEKSQIQALDRTQPGLPLKKGRAGTMTHDYKRNGATTLFAALNVLDGAVIGRNMQRHRHQEFIRFLNEIERQVPTGKGRTRNPRQLRGAQAPQGAGLARPPPPLDAPFHAHIVFLAERRRGVLCKTREAAAQTRRLPFPRRSPGRHQPLPRRAQRNRSETLSMDR